ncbi:hypothetical protein M758_4G154600 [Ceratodon purpureus]|nr:hypothetical protein M758_4G154600 [Ceratodon purpureus]
MAEIDTAAPFASVKDAICMFGEHSTNTIQRAFPTANALIQKIHSLEEELNQLREEYANIQNQLITAETTTSDPLKELVETTTPLEESKTTTEYMISSRISSLELQLDATLKHESQRAQEMECYREEMKKLSNELKVLKAQHKSTLDMLTSSQNENDKLRDDFVRETEIITSRHEQYLVEQENVAKEHMKNLLEDLLATKDMLTKANAARKKMEEEFQIDEGTNLQRMKEEFYNSTILIEQLKNELQDAEDKQEGIILAVERLKDELLAAKESERKALQRENDANIAMKSMKIEVEDSKFAKEKVRMMAIQLEDVNSKLKNATQEEQNLLASLASLRAELKNANNEVQNLKKEVEDTTIEMEEQINHLQDDLNAAVLRETKSKICISNLNEALQQVTAEAVEAKAAAIQASDEVVAKTQELEETLLHNQTLECRLQASIKETDAAKAAEVFAHTEVKFLRKKINNSMDVNRNGEDSITISYDEYETMAKKVIDSENLAKKRIVAAIAQADASKASELEISKKLESIKNLLERSQIAMKQAVQVAEAAEAAKSAVEGELRKWRSENEQRRKAAVAAVMAVGSTEDSKHDCSVVIGDNSFFKSGTIGNESTRGLSNGSPNALQPKESLAQLLRYSFSKDEKIKKNLLSTKISAYFNKRIK